MFNIEGGCYAKVIKLSKEQEPDIWNALQFGAVLENVKYADQSHLVNYDDTSITENTRGSYVLDTIPNAKLPATSGHPKNVIFLTADAFGVLPPVSRLTPAQAMYHYISGYTAKVAGTEVGVKDPEPTFSACFGGPFLVWHPTKYAELLAEKLRKHGTETWLVNTRLVGRRVRHRHAHEAQVHARDHRRDPLGCARRQRADGRRSRVRLRGPDDVPRRSERRSCSRATPGPTRPRTTTSRRRSPRCSARTSRSTSRRHRRKCAAADRRSDAAARDARAARVVRDARAATAGAASAGAGAAGACGGHGATGAGAAGWLCGSGRGRRASLARREAGVVAADRSRRRRRRRTRRSSAPAR